MSLYDLYGQIDPKNELWIKAKYDHIVETKQENYCLVTLMLKNFNSISHELGNEESERVIHQSFEILADLLSQDEYIARIHIHYFNLLIKSEPTEESLHPRAHQFHFAIRDIIEEKTGKKLYLEMGFYPMIKEGVDFYSARYYADLCRNMSHHQKYAESSYELYYLSYVDQKEEYAKFQDLVQDALENENFKLYLQPKVELSTGKVTGAEALVRWIDPQRGMLLLAKFLPSLEENGSIRDVDRYLFDKACSYIERWHKNYNQDFVISFNLSEAYYNGPYFMPEYKETYKKYQFPKELIRIELLESIVLNDLEKLKPLVDEIYDFGFSCALDDFGSGFSSFDILINVKLSELKIDRSLFQDCHNEKERLVIKGIVDVAHNLGMKVVAEGIEIKEYVDYLTEIGCDYIQGFYFYKPMPIDEFEKIFVLK